VTSEPDLSRTTAGRPLVVTSEPALLEELLRLCSAAGITPAVAADPVALRRGWPIASVVLLGSDLAESAARQPRRTGVVVVGTAADRLWELAADVGAGHVAVLPSAADWLLGLLNERGEPAGAHARVLCVVGGQGGAGATTFSAALARSSAARGKLTLLVDADPFGGGIDLALGLESAAGDRWPQLLGEPATVSGFIERLPARAGLHVLGPDRDSPASLPAELVRRVVQEGRRRCGLVVVDLPRALDPGATAALILAERVYLLVPAQVRAVAAAAQLARALQDVAADVQAVVRGPAPGGLSSAAIMRSLGIPLAGGMRAEPGLTRDYERGVPPGQPRGPLARFCTQLLDQLDTDGQRTAA
jgi:secretion/DNA translocation related CpaE-like protein